MLRALFVPPLCALALLAQETPFLKPGSLDLPRLLPPPPAMDSPAGRVDLQGVLQTQTWRTPAQVAFAESVEHGTVWDFAAVLGPQFAKAHVPKTAALLARFQHQVGLLSQEAKRLHQRPRPPKADARIQPCVPFSDSPSYPSGHGLQLYACAALLGELFPHRREALRQEADRLAWGRVIGGVHFPSDLEAARGLAGHLMKALLDLPAFKTAMEACRAEVQPLSKAS